MPDTTQYMIYGLIAVGVLLALYILILGFRFRAVRRERKLIEQLQQD